jgi:hypothetical protein
MGTNIPGRLPSRSPGVPKSETARCGQVIIRGTRVRTVQLSHGNSKLPQLIVPAGYSALQGSAGARLRQLTHAEQMDGTRISRAPIAAGHRLVGLVPTLKVDAELWGSDSQGSAGQGLRLAFTSVSGWEELPRARAIGPRRHLQEPLAAQRAHEPRCQESRLQIEKSIARHCE